MPEPDIRILRGCVADGILRTGWIFDKGVGLGFESWGTEMVV